jgi:ubiquinone/menaquinone biosynthesis C-methylase UbiE
MGTLLRNGISFDWIDDTRCVLEQESEITPSDRKEFAAYRKTRTTRTAKEGQELFDDIVFKSNNIKAFRELIPRLELAPGQRVLELGAGQGWASVILKGQYRDCEFVASDLVPDALSFCRFYEELLGVSLDEKWAHNVRQMPFADAQFDRIFTFAAFHHFGSDEGFGPSIAEMLRVLKPGGKILFLYEPSSPKWLYKRAYRRVNRRANLDGVDEEVIVPGRLVAEVEALGASVQIDYFPESKYREGLKQTIYYAVLSRFRPIARMTVSTINITINHRLKANGPRLDPVGSSAALSK